MVKMPTQMIYFMGILSNVDSSILKVIFDHGFKVEGRPDHGQCRVYTNNTKDTVVNYKEVALLIRHFEGLPLGEVYKKLDFELSCLNVSEKKIYVITNSIEFDVKMNDKGISTEVAKFDKLVYDYLYPIIRLMRLFKEGNISMPLLHYYFIDNDGTPRPYKRIMVPLRVLKGTYTLEDSEILKLPKFIKNIKLPFTEPSLQIAFESFELSYQISDINLSFLTLMISLEALLNPGKQELTYKVSRNTAVLLGGKEDDSKNIFLKVKKLYDKRSKFVHGEKTNIIKIEDLLLLRYYIRESIKEINKIGKTRKELWDLLNSRGFSIKTMRK